MPSCLMILVGIVTYTIDIADSTYMISENGWMPNIVPIYV